ncbi:MAG: hypothetical protein WC558_13400 [Patulibacter sp.]
MRSGITRILGVVLVSVFAATATVTSASAHGGATLAEGGSNGVQILLQGTDSTTSGGQPAVDLSTVVRGSGTDDAVVTFWVRPAGGETFRVATERDEAGVSHADVATADRGSWREWDVSAVVRLNDGTRLRVSNAEANPPGPDPASTPGGGATGPDPDSDEGTSTATTPTESATTPAQTATTETAPAETATTETAPSSTTATESDDDAAPVSDVTGESDGAPGWVIPSLIGVVLVGLAWAVFFRRPKRGEDGRDPDRPFGDDDQGVPPVA